MQTVSFAWSGGDEPYLDTQDVHSCGHVTVGRYGGCAASGAHKNEDAALVWAAPDNSWTFAALLDAHGSSESTVLVRNRIAELEEDVTGLLSTEANPPLWELSTRITRHLQEESFRQACAAVRGETALLLCAQKGNSLWWLSIGDIPVYVFHPEFARLGQFALNQRMFFEWIGQVNTFALTAPGYAMGVRQLRPGPSRILMTTDGLLECGSHLLENPHSLYKRFAPVPVGETPVSTAVEEALALVHREQGRDSATLLAWEVNVPDTDDILYPSA